MGETPLKHPKTANSIVALAAAALVAGAIGFFLLGRTDRLSAEADSGATTEFVAAATGARVLPTDPKLKVEPK